MDRRSFVKACVGVAGAGALAATGISMAATLAIPRSPGGGVIDYYGAHKVAGPAPRGVPYIPVTVNAAGEFEGLPLIRRGNEEINVLEWYKYCGHAGAPGLRQGWTDDNRLYYFIAEEKLHSITPWFNDLLGQPIRPEHFPAPGFGASFIWRSQGQTGANIITGVLIRNRVDEFVLQATAVAPARPLRDDADFQFVRDNIFHEGYVGVSTYCTHFCCIPGYREAEALARPRGGWDSMFCTCHNSVYDQREPVLYGFSPEVTGGEGARGFDPLLTRGGRSGGGGGGGH